MTLLFASLFLIALIVAGVFLFKFLSKKVEKEPIAGISDLINYRKKKDSYRPAIFFFSALLSLAFVTWSFDTQYTKLVEKKLYAQQTEKVDSLKAYVMQSTPPPPPPKQEVKPKIEEIKVEVPKIEIVKEVVEEKKNIQQELNTDDFDFNSNNTNNNNSNNKNQQLSNDDNLYSYDDLTTKPSYPGGQPEETKYLSNMLRDVKAPRNAKPYVVSVIFIIYPDGSIKDVSIMKQAIELDDRSKQKIIDAFLKMPKWSPPKMLDRAVKVRYVQRIPLQ
jgi:hypothetical protein